MPSSPLKPSAALLSKVGSILVHVEEATSAKGHAFDWHVVEALLTDPEVRAWLEGMRKLALLPVKR